MLLEFLTLMAVSGGLIQVDSPTTRACSRLLVNDKTTASSQTSGFQLRYIKPYQKLQLTKVYYSISNCVHTCPVKRHVER